ncbi:HNH endonuclease family protein [Streptomyces sp. NBC_00289]|uniref:HNH endonuclease family protein n=1 Tax=Streptomyces sp. NBC_00289 TaxID=2975703 RepID=UPI0032448443
MYTWIPDNEIFKADFEEAEIPKASQARYLLQKIEGALRLSAGVDELEVSGNAKVHVDQIYPQQPGQELRLEEHDSWIHRLGNLTLLSGRKNQAFSNRPYPEKAASYAESALLISSQTNVSNLWDSEKSQWRPEGISERQARLAKVALSVWPGASQWSGGRT